MTTKKQTYQSGSILGRWTLIDNLGEGGNGEVWSASSNNEKSAIKILKTNDKKKLDRFKEEIILINQELIEVPGVIKIIDYDSSLSPKWFTMPIAESSFDFLKNKSLSTKLELFVELVQSIIQLHDKNITHRDIKPANILVLNNKLMLADFGLGHRPTRINNWTVESNRKGVGAMSTIAPEMRRYSKENPVYNYKPGDVCSLAKTLWIYLAENDLGFDGEYVKSSVLSLKNYIEVDFHYILPLIEDLILKSTNTNPSDRPNIKDFYTDLVYIWQNINDFDHNNHIHWLDIINIIFPISFPKYAKWENIDDVFKILSQLIKTQHYVFYPNGKGNTFPSIERENNKIKLITKMKNNEIIINPILTFNSFEKDPTLNYFRLECDYEENKKIKKGVFLFFSKASLYNKYMSTDDGSHNKMDEFHFRDLIEKTINYFYINNISI
jgi:serine/threonine protein kinase